VKIYRDAPTLLAAQKKMSAIKEEEGCDYHPCSTTHLIVIMIMTAQIQQIPRMPTMMITTLIPLIAIVDI
jgi:hypothetical protein